jgi:uncharacterized damage-inducible protein DinB
MSAEAGWLERCGSPKRGARFVPEAFPTFASIKERWQQLDGQLIDFLAALTDDDVQRTITYSIDDRDNLRMRLGEMMEHAANHGVHHRGQVSAMLRMLGHAPVDVDLLIYYAEKRGLVAW